MRIGRLEIAWNTPPPAHFFPQPFWYYTEDPCFCKMLEIGCRLHVCWLSHECMAGIHKDKARLYRVRRYLEKRRARAAAKPQ